MSVLDQIGKMERQLCRVDPGALNPHLVREWEAMLGYLRTTTEVISSGGRLGPAAAGRLERVLQCYPPVIETMLGFTNRGRRPYSTAELKRLGLDKEREELNNTFDEIRARIPSL